MNSHGSFIDFAKSRVDLTEEEICAIEGLLPAIQVKKGDVLLAEGEVSNAFYYVVKGCVRMYYMVDGMDKSAFFYTEGDFVSSYESFIKRLPSEHYLQCMEDAMLIEISWANSEQLLQASPKFDAFARIIMEEELAHYQRLLASYITKTPEQRYLDFLHSNKNLLQRLPQHYIASFLGVSPESLSRIKNRVLEKERIS